MRILNGTACLHCLAVLADRYGANVDPIEPEDPDIKVGGILGLSFSLLMLCDKGQHRPYIAH